MADNVAITAGSGTPIAADELAGGIFIQRVKPAWGVDGAAVDTSASNPLPVVQTGTIAAITTVSAVTAITNALPAGTNNIGDVDVLTLPALPAGSNAIGKLAANSGVDIGDVDVTSLVPGTGATSLGKAIDSVAGATDTGVAFVGIRDDALTTLTPVDGDWVPARFSSTGALHVAIASSAVGSTTDTEDGTVADGQSSVALVINLPYTWDGDNFTRAGNTVFKTIDLDESEEEVKATAGVVYGGYFYNASASVRYLKFYNLTAANTTVGSSTIVATMPLPPTTGGNLTLPAMGINFSTAISVAATTGLADNDTGAPSANDVILMLYYK